MINRDGVRRIAPQVVHGDVGAFRDGSESGDSDLHTRDRELPTKCVSSVRFSVWDFEPLPNQI